MKKFLSTVNDTFEDKMLIIFCPQVFLVDNIFSFLFFVLKSPSHIFFCVVWYPFVLKNQRFIPGKMTNTRFPSFAFFPDFCYTFFIKNTIKIWLSAKTQYLSAFSRKQTHQFTTYLLPLNEPWYASFPRYAKIWYSTSVLKQEKIE